MLVTIAHRARQVLVVSPLPIVVVGAFLGGGARMEVLFLVLVPFAAIRGLVVLTSRSTRDALARKPVHWLGEHYLPPSKGGGIYSLVFGVFAAALGISGLAGLG